jgi:hypothetical protein
LTFTVRTKRSAPGNRVVIPASGSTGDPTVHGGTLIVANSAGSRERVRVDLPAAGWRSIGTPLKPKGYQFRDSSPAAPIATVVVKADALTVKGRGAGWAYTLDEAEQGRVAVRLGLGDVAWCANAAARIDLVDQFEGQKSSPPPPVCPISAAP